jgi:YrbI family 3-deoxy-D-manno-octulosonate 8-phosphate phosphatase
MECLAIIPARGGSKGIPRKNVLPLAGKPLIAHNIEQARLARQVNRVVVSTDDPEIAAVVQRYGAEVVWRPAEISGDTASSESALLHVLESLRRSEDYQPDLVAFLQCTSPLTLAEDIDGTIQALQDQEADTSLAVIPFHYFLWRIDPDQAGGGNATGINHDKSVRPLRQEREPQYLETGAVYVMKAAGFEQARHRFFGKTALYVMPSERRLEIDEPVDFQIAEVLLRSQDQARRQAALPKPVQALVMDFDGVFTDNRVIVFQDGREAVICNRSDGWGIAQLRKSGLPMLILSTETNPVVQARADKLSIPCVHGIQDKGRALQAWLSSKDLDPDNIVYVGNDLNDLPCLELVGCPVAVADAHPRVIQQATLVLEHVGGDGALREICELILAADPTLDFSGKY